MDYATYLRIVAIADRCGTGTTNRRKVEELVSYKNNGRPCTCRVVTTEKVRGDATHSLVCALYAKARAAWPSSYPR